MAADFSNITDPKVRAMLDLPPLPAPKRRAGNPGTRLAPTFEEALAALTPREADFVRHVLAGKRYGEAYRATSEKPLDEHGARVNGSRMAKRDAVAHAIRLGKQAGAKQAITGMAYDLKAAHRELEEKIAAAEKAEQFTAVANLMQQKLKLHGLLIDRQQVEQASLVVNISGVDTSRLVNPPRTFENGEGGSNE